MEDDDGTPVFCSRLKRKYECSADHLELNTLDSTSSGLQLPLLPQLAWYISHSLVRSAHMPGEERAQAEDRARFMKGCGHGSASARTIPPSGLCLADHARDSLHSDTESRGDC